MKKVKSNTVVMRLRNSNLRRVVAGIPITAIIAVLLSFGASAQAAVAAYRMRRSISVLRRGADCQKTKTGCWVKGV
jgi:hypothetical protein